MPCDVQCCRSSRRGDLTTREEKIKPFNFSFRFGGRHIKCIWNSFVQSKTSVSCRFKNDLVIKIPKACDSAFEAFVMLVEYQPLICRRYLSPLKDCVIFTCNLTIFPLENAFHVSEETSGIATKSYLGFFRILSFFYENVTTILFLGEPHRRLHFFPVPLMIFFLKMLRLFLSPKTLFENAELQI